MQKRDERPSSITPKGDETDLFLDQPPALLAGQATLFIRLDTIAQILFSAGLIADVLSRLEALSPQEGRVRQVELTLLTEHALAEVRKLLIELRLAEWVEGERKR